MSKTKYVIEKKYIKNLNLIKYKVINSFLLKLFYNSIKKGILKLFLQYSGIVYGLDMLGELSPRGFIKINHLLFFIKDFNMSKTKYLIEKKYIKNLNLIKYKVINSFLLKLFHNSIKKGILKLFLQYSGIVYGLDILFKTKRVFGAWENVIIEMRQAGQVGE